jgi:hypothetical protein
LLNNLSKSQLNNQFQNQFRKLRLRSQNKKFHLFLFNNHQLLRRSQSNKKPQFKSQLPPSQLLKNQPLSKPVNKSQLSKVSKSNPEETTEDTKDQEKTEDQGKTDHQESTEVPDSTEVPERIEAQEERDKRVEREEDTTQIIQTDKDPTTDPRTRKRRDQDQTHLWKESKS